MVNIILHKFICTFFDDIVNFDHHRTYEQEYVGVFCDVDPSLGFQGHTFVVSSNFGSFRLTEPIHRLSGPCSWNWCNSIALSYVQCDLKFEICAKL